MAKKTIWTIIDELTTSDKVEAFLKRKANLYCKNEAQIYHYRDIAINNGHKHFDWDSYSANKERAMDGHWEEAEMVIKYDGFMKQRSKSEQEQLWKVFRSYFVEHDRKMNNGEYNQYK